MSPSEDKPYPGQIATAADLRALADEYRRAAKLVAPLGRRGAPLSRSPYRLLAIQAIELYLNALLLARGHTPAAVRRLGHDLAARADLAVATGLLLRARTAAHLKALAANREYLISRYGPEPIFTLCPTNRLTATMDEIAGKTSALIDRVDFIDAKHSGQQAQLACQSTTAR